MIRLDDSKLEEKRGKSNRIEYLSSGLISVMTARKKSAMLIISKHLIAVTQIASVCFLQ